MTYSKMCKLMESQTSNEMIEYTWDTLYRMSILGLITQEAWKKFYEKYKAYEVA